MVLVVISIADSSDTKSHLAIDTYFGINQLLCLQEQKIRNYSIGKEIYIMDILRYIAECIWDFLGGMYSEVILLLLRWSLLLMLICITGMATKELYRRGLRDTLIVQILGIVISISVALSVPLEFIFRMPENLRSISILISISNWLLLPYPASKLIIRSFGYQVLARRILFLVEVFLIVLQTLICIFTRL